MRKHMGLVVLAALVVLFLVVYMVAFQVSELTDIAVVTTFGKTGQVFSGRDPGEAGLHFKWIPPVQEVLRYDARTFLFEAPLEQTSTQDRKNILISLFCAWRIDDPRRFVSSIKTVAAAQERIKSAIRSAESDAVGKHDLADLVNTDPARMKLKEVEDAFMAAVSKKLHDDYGVQIVMIGVKRLGLPQEVTKTVIETMKAESQAKAQEYETRGDALATAIKERARAAAGKILAFADRKARDIRSQGDADAAVYYQKYHGHEELAVFTRALETLKTLKDRTVILLDDSALPMVKWMRAAPTVESLRQMTTTQPAAPTAATGG